MVVPTVLANTASITALRPTGASAAVAGVIDNPSSIRNSPSSQLPTNALPVGIQLGRGPARQWIRESRDLDGVTRHEQGTGADDHVAGPCLWMGDRLGYVLHQT